MYNAKVVMCEHHGIFFGTGIGGIDFGMTVKMCIAVRFFTLIEFQCLVHGLFIQGVCGSGIHFACECKLDYSADTLESSVASFNTDLADFKSADIIDQIHMEYIDCSGSEQCITYFLTAVDADVFTACETCGLFQHSGITDHDGITPFIEVFVCQSLDCDFRAVSGRITHGNSDDWFFTHLHYLLLYGRERDQHIPLALFSSSTFRRALIPSSGIWLKGARHLPTLYPSMAVAVLTTVFGFPYLKHARKL